MTNNEINRLFHLFETVFPTIKYLSGNIILYPDKKLLTNTRWSWDVYIQKGIGIYASPSKYSIKGIRITKSWLKSYVQKMKLYIEYYKDNVIQTIQF